jgi:hypothetical protein
MGKRNYPLFQVILQLEIKRQISGDVEKYKKEFAALLCSNSTNRHTIYDTRLVVLKFLKELEPYMKATGKLAIVTAEISDLAKALEGLNL